MVGSSAIKQGRSANRKHTYFFFGLSSFLASHDFCRLLINFANSLDPDQGRHSFGPYLGPNCLQGLLADNKSRCLQVKS